MLTLAALLLAMNVATVHGEDSLPSLKDGKAPQTFEEMWAGFDPRAEPLDVEVLHVAAQVGVRPGDAVVVPGDDPGGAGEGKAAQLEGAGLGALHGPVLGHPVQGDLVPDRGHLDAQVHVVGQ